MIEIKQGSLSQELKKQIYEGFSRHAIAMTGYDDKNDPIAFVAMDDHIFAGAAVVDLFWGALHVKYVYVEENYRHKGLGRLLMQKVFAFGLSNRCPFAFLETMSFQALEFYQKLGFVLEFTRSGYSHNTSFHYLKKVL